MNPGCTHEYRPLKVIDGVMTVICALCREEKVFDPVAIGQRVREREEALEDEWKRIKATYPPPPVHRRTFAPIVPRGPWGDSDTVGSALWCINQHLDKTSRRISVADHWAYDDDAFEISPDIYELVNQ